ncbi:3662_t:CDS:2, partial [Ambispora leptoticha]
QRYIILKRLSEDVKEIRTELRRQHSDVENDLSLKVLEETFKGYLEEKFTDFMSNLSANEFANCFYDQWLSLESRIRREIDQYLSDFESGSGLSHELADNILNDENRHNELSREALPQHTEAKSESPAPRSPFMSQKEIDELFELDL